MNRWEHTYFKAALADSPIDTDEGIIRDVVMVQVGEAKGHGVLLEQEFIDTAVELAQDHMPLGLKARFGHPTMCSEALGTMLGRFKNVRKRGTQMIGDLHFAEFAADSPEGDLRKYVMKRAQEDPNSFGASIVFTRGNLYQRGEDGEKIYEYQYTDSGELKRDEDGYPMRDKRWSYSETPYIEIKQLLGTDLVDEAAATTGLFSDHKLFAARITRFLDENPDIDQFLNEHPDIETKIAGFLSRRKAFTQSRPEMDQKEVKGLFSQVEKKLDQLRQFFGAKASGQEAAAEPEAESPAPTSEDAEDITLSAAELAEEIASLQAHAADREVIIANLQANLTELQEQQAAREQEFQTRVQELEQELTQLGAAVDGEEAPAPSADANPGHVASQADPFAEIHQYAALRKQVREKYRKNQPAA